MLLDRIRSKSYLPSFVQRGQHVLLILVWRTAATRAATTCLGALICVRQAVTIFLSPPYSFNSQNARVRLQSWMARKPSREQMTRGKTLTHTPGTNSQ